MVINANEIGQETRKWRSMASLNWKFLVSRALFEITTHLSRQGRWIIQSHNGIPSYSHSGHTNNPLCFSPSSTTHSPTVESKCGSFSPWKIHKQIKFFHRYNSIPTSLWYNIIEFIVNFEEWIKMAAMLLEGKTHAIFGTKMHTV